MIFATLRSASRSFTQFMVGIDRVAGKARQALGVPRWSRTPYGVDEIRKLDLIKISQTSSYQVILYVSALRFDSTNRTPVCVAPDIERIAVIRYVERNPDVVCGGNPGNVGCGGS